MLTRLLDKFKEIEASTKSTYIKNDKLNILTQILLLDNLFESLKNEDQQLLSFLSEESVFTEISRFCFGLFPDFTFSPEFVQHNQDEIRNILSFKSLNILLNIPSSFYSDILSLNFNFNAICSNLLLHNIKCYILKICNEIIKNNLDSNENNIKLIDTHFFGFFSQVIFKMIKWNFPIFFSPDTYKQKMIEINKKCEVNTENHFQYVQNSEFCDDSVEVQIENYNELPKKIDNLNQIIEKLGLYLTLNIHNDQQKSKTFITITQNITDPLFPNFKYISNLIICNIHDNYAMQEFLVEILKSYPEALPDGNIIKRLSYIACGDIESIIKCNKNCNNDNSANNNQITCKETENINKPPNQEISSAICCCDNIDNFDFNSIFKMLTNKFCTSVDACYTLVDIYRSLPSESPIFYQFSDSTVLNNIIKAASLIHEESKDSNNSFKHIALAAGLIDIATKAISTNTKLLSSIDIPLNLIISEGNVDEVTIAAIEIYLRKNRFQSDETSKCPIPSNKSKCPKSHTPNYHSLCSNISNIALFQMQSQNSAKSKADIKNNENKNYSIECDIFKLFFTSEKLQNKLITLFFNNESSKSNSSFNKFLIQSSSTNCINIFDSSNILSTNSSFNSLRYQTGIDCSYPRSASTGAWSTDKLDQNSEQSFLTAIATIPGLVDNLEAAFEKDRRMKMHFSYKRKSNINDEVTNSVPSFSLENSDNSSSHGVLPVSSSSNESSMITSSSYDTLENSNSKDNLDAPRWTPACKFLALELTKLTYANTTLPELNSRRWKSVITPNIRRFNLVLDSSYGYNDSPLARHRSCSMNDKIPTFSSNSPSSSLGSGSKSYCYPTFSKNTSNSNKQSESRINSFEKVKFSSNFLNFTKEDSIPQININDKANDGIDPDLPTLNLYDGFDENGDGLIEPLEVDINLDNFETDDLQKITNCKSESHKNYPHSFNINDTKNFSNLPAGLSSQVPKSPDFSRYPVPPLKPTDSNSNSSSSDSSTSLASIKMSTRQTLIQKKKGEKPNNSPPPPPLASSSNSEGEDEYIIDI